MFYSFIIPAFNRPDEIKELLDSFTELNLPTSSFDGVEVIIADGSPTEILVNVVADFKNKIQVKHLHHPKLAISPARNLGAEQAQGDYLIFLDSDVVLPNDYLIHLHSFLLQNPTDSFGGPDAAHGSFTAVQKAISFAMTSYLTTGGIRGGKRQLHAYNPRGFNMGVKKEVFQKMNGFSMMTCGEDIELSIRLLEANYSVRLIPEAFVYHKRRSTFKSFFRQVFRFGAARINIFYHHRKELKLTHFFPSVFLIFLITGIIGSIFNPILFKIFIFGVAVYYGMIFIFSSAQEKNLKVGLLSIIAATCQLCGYGLGFLANAFEVFVKGHKDGLRLGASK